MKQVNQEVCIKYIMVYEELTFRRVAKKESVNRQTE